MLKRPVCWLVLSACHSPFVSVWLYPAPRRIPLAGQKQTASKSKPGTLDRRKEKRAVTALMGPRGKHSHPGAPSAPARPESLGPNWPHAFGATGSPPRAWLLTLSCDTRVAFLQRFVEGELHSGDRTCMCQQPHATDGATESPHSRPREGSWAKITRIRKTQAFSLMV